VLYRVISLKEKPGDLSKISISKQELAEPNAILEEAPETGTALEDSQIYKK